MLCAVLPFVWKDGKLLSTIDFNDTTEIDLSDTISATGKYLIYVYAYTDGADWESKDFAGRVSNLIEYTVDWQR